MMTNKTTSCKIWAMFDRFAAARLKIERANKHITDFENIATRLKDSYVSSLKRHEPIRCQVISYSPPDFPGLGAAMALIIGDAIHNLRVAIEYAYLGAVERHAPTVLDSHTKFPVGETREDVEARLTGRKIDVLSPKLFNRIVADIRPYVDSGNCLIKMLHDLDVSDKHWLLIPVARVGDVTDIVVEDEKGNVITGNTHPTTGDGPYTITFPLEYNVKNHGNLTVDVVFGETDIGLLQSMPILSDLQDFSRIAARIVDLLESV